MNSIFVFILFLLLIVLCYILQSKTIFTGGGSTSLETLIYEESFNAVLPVDVAISGPCPKEYTGAKSTAGQEPKGRLCKTKIVSI